MVPVRIWSGTRCLVDTFVFLPISNPNSRLYFVELRQKRRRVLSSYYGFEFGLEIEGWFKMSGCVAVTIDRPGVRTGRKMSARTDGDVNTDQQSGFRCTELVVRRSL